MVSVGKRVFHIPEPRDEEGNRLEFQILRSERLILFPARYTFRILKYFLENDFLEDIKKSFQVPLRTAQHFCQNGNHLLIFKILSNSSN